MEKNLRTCVVCHSKYSFCPKCRVDEDKPTWYFIFCTEHCKDIYEVLSSYENGYIDAKTADKQLKDLNISQINDWGDSYKNTIAKIAAEIKKTDEAAKKKAVSKKPIKAIAQNEISEKDKIDVEQ